MTYATGRVPNYSERKEIEAIVEANHEHGNGFQDLLLGLIASDTFREIAHQKPLKRYLFLLCRQSCSLGRRVRQADFPRHL